MTPTNLRIDSFYFYCSFNHLCHRWLEQYIAPTSRIRILQSMLNVLFVIWLCLSKLLGTSEITFNSFNYCLFCLSVCLSVCVFSVAQPISINGICYVVLHYSDVFIRIRHIFVAGCGAATLFTDFWWISTSERPQRSRNSSTESIVFENTDFSLPSSSFSHSVFNLPLTRKNPSQRLRCRGDWKKKKNGVNVDDVRVLWSSMQKLILIHKIIAISHNNINGCEDNVVEKSSAELFTVSTWSSPS